MWGKSYFEYTVGDPVLWQTNASGWGGTAYTEDPIVLKQGCYMQSVKVTGTEVPKFHYISLNSPIIEYGTPASSTATLYNAISANGWNNINEGANNFRFLSIYETYMKITALPAVQVPDAEGTNELTVNDLNWDSLCLYFMYPNGKDPDNYYLGNRDTGETTGGTIPAPLTHAEKSDPIGWLNAQGDYDHHATSLSRTQYLKKIPLNTPNTVGGGRTVLTAKWRSPKGLRGNVSDVKYDTVGLIPLRWYDAPRDLYSDEVARANNDHKWRFYWAIGSDIGKAGARYQYRFKIQMWCKYKAWDLIQNLPTYIGWVQRPTGSVGPSGPENQKEKEKEVDEPMDIGELPNSMPATPVLEQMFSEFARLQEKMAKSSSVTFNK